jgi:hypothetical protein
MANARAARSLDPLGYQLNLGHQLILSSLSA